MDVKIPGILSGQGGYADAVKESGREIGRSLREMGGVLDTIQNQRDSIEAMRLENDMNVTKQKSYDTFMQSQDGTDSTAMATWKAEDERITQEYISQASNPRVSRYLTKAGLVSQREYSLTAQKTLDGKLFDTSIEAAKIKTDDVIRTAVRTGEYSLGLQNIDNYLESQRNFFGPATDGLKKKEIQRYTEDYLKTSLQNPTAAPLLVQRMADPEQKKQIYANLDPAKMDDIERTLQTAGKRVAETDAYAGIYNDPNMKDENGGVNYKKAAEYALSPEAAKKYNLDINQQQNIAQSFSLSYAAHETAKKDTQEKNMQELFTLGTTNPGAALKKARELAVANKGEYDPKELYSFQKALESHIRNISLMSAQEKQARLAIEDQGQAKIKVNILGNAYKSEQELVNAVFAAGFSNTSAFLTEAVNMYRTGRKENYGQVNNFKNAQEDWDLLITTTKSKGAKRELKDKKVEMENTLAAWMVKNNIPVSDPRVTEQYKVIRQNLTETWVQKQLHGIPLIGNKENAPADTFAKPPKVQSVPMFPEGTKRTRINSQGKKETQVWDGKQWVNG